MLSTIVALHVCLFIHAEKAKISLSLPFSGFWKVSQGNHGTFSHKGYSEYAWDFVRVDPKGMSSQNAKIPHLKAHHSFGARVKAPAPGQIMNLRDSEPDQSIGSFSHTAIPNFVLIDHGNGEASLLSHLQKQRIFVKESQNVRRSQTIGLAGNSGRTTAPHLHYAVVLLSNTKQTIPAHFENIVLFKDGKIVKHPSGIPMRGEIVANNLPQQKKRHNTKAYWKHIMTALKTKLNRNESLNLHHRSPHNTGNYPCWPNLSTIRLLPDQPYPIYQLRSRQQSHSLTSPAQGKVWAIFLSSPSYGTAIAIRFEKNILHIIGPLIPGQIWNPSTILRKMEPIGLRTHTPIELLILQKNNGVWSPSAASPTRC